MNWCSWLRLAIRGLGGTRYSPGSCWSSPCWRASDVGVEVTPALEIGSVEAIKNAVLAGLGVSFISRHAIRVEQELGLLAAIPVRGVTLQRPFYCIHHGDDYWPPAVEAFVGFARESAQNP